MIEVEAEKLIKRYGGLFRKDKFYYAFDYSLEHTIDEKGKKKYTRQPWFVDHKIEDKTYFEHLNADFLRAWGLILPPTNDKNEASFGAIDRDIYDDPEDLKRIVKQIYGEKLPLVPCYSKSKGLHIYMLFNENVPAGKIRAQLQHYNKYLKINAKEVNPKQTKLKWNKSKKRFDPGNGILLPYMNCLEHKNKEILFKECLNPWIKNADLETGSLEEFVDYAESVSVSKDFFGEQPIELEEKIETKPKEITPIIETEERDFAESNARPLSKSLLQIIQNIKNKKEHSRGGTFDNHVIDFVYGSIESKISDKHIHEHLDQVWEYADKEGDQYQGRDQEDYISFKITNCREKYDKIDTGPLRVNYMKETIYDLKGKKYHNTRTKNSYEKEPYDIKFAHIFPKSRSSNLHTSKNITNKQLAEEETYRPDLHKENDLH